MNGNSYEHFMLTNGRGAGFHHFSGLSSPVLDWYRVYYVPGNAAAGFDTAILHQAWNEDCTAVDITVEARDPRAVLIVTLREGHTYRLSAGPRGARMRALHPGTYCVRCGAAGVVELSIDRA